jgi:transaldolase/glucose-6-phosphate isomerase
MKDSIGKLHEMRQSIWYDNIQRRLLESGEMEAMIQRGEIKGVTSNPSIFHNAISKTNDYDLSLEPMAWAGWDEKQIFNLLAVQDIQKAADLFRPLYEETNGGDGYVSLEVSPLIAHDTQSTINEARLLWMEVNRPNLMIKIPATLEGLEAITETIAAGINVNVTLIFSLERYAQVIDAYLKGLEKRVDMGLPVDKMASVASFFVSRLDTKVDALLEAINQKDPARKKETEKLFGKAAIANTKLAYVLFDSQFKSERFQALRAKGGRIQRPLWASTSTKNPTYRDVMYVEELIAPDSVNTVPPQTLTAFIDHGKARLSIVEGLDEARRNMDALEKLGISMRQVTQELEDEGVKAFADAYTALLATIHQRKEAAKKQTGFLIQKLPTLIEKMETEATLERFVFGDASLWTDDPEGQKEIERRLGWIKLPESSQAMLGELSEFVDGCQQSGFTQALLLGMGGSSLAPEVFCSVFGQLQSGKGLALRIIDSTDPKQVRDAADWAAVKNTLYIVSSKSGGTSEVNALFACFWEHARKTLGEKAGDHFIAITDAGTSLERLAKEKGFRRIFLADSQVGGRYSALSAFGLVPAALLGIDIKRLLNNAAVMANYCGGQFPAASNPGYVLGAMIAQAALDGSDKLTFIADPEVAAFGNWLEQLIAESSGKQGKGITPVVGEKVKDPSAYGNDRFFVYLKHSGAHTAAVARLLEAGYPAITFTLMDAYDLGREFYRWEAATAIACAVLKVNAFDQPDVQDSKTRTASLIETYKQTRRLEDGEPLWNKQDIQVYGKAFAGIERANSIHELINGFLKQKRDGDYLAILAYMPRNHKMEAWLQQLRDYLGDACGLATTLGFGPRFLHSTGQLHKGGPDNGLFIQITTDKEVDLDIPGFGLTFGALQKAQALGDLQALLERGRRAIRIHVKETELDKLFGK